MIATDEAALRCDFFETYGLKNFRELPARQAALFSCGLREDSRIMRKLSGSPVGIDTILLATIADALKILVWQNTEDGRRNRNQPKSILDHLQNREKKTESQGFESAAEFEAWRNSMLKGGETNG